MPARRTGLPVEILCLMLFLLFWSRTNMHDRRARRNTWGDILGWFMPSLRQDPSEYRYKDLRMYRKLSIRTPSDIFKRLFPFLRRFPSCSCHNTSYSSPTPALQSLLHSYTRAHTSNAYRFRLRYFTYLCRCYASSKPLPPLCPQQ